MATCAQALSSLRINMHWLRRSKPSLLPSARTAPFTAADAHHMMLRAGSKLRTISVGPLYFKVSDYYPALMEDSPWLVEAGSQDIVYPSEGQIIDSSLFSLFPVSCMSLIRNLYLFRANGYTMTAIALAIRRRARDRCDSGCSSSMLAMCVRRTSIRAKLDW